MGEKAKDITKLVAYNGDSPMTIGISRTAKGDLEVKDMASGKDIFKEKSFENLKFLVPIDNTISCITREQFNRYLIVYGLSTDL